MGMSPFIFVWRLLLLVSGVILACESSFVDFEVLDSFLLTKPHNSYNSAERALTWGDYSEIPETCPAKITCPIICVTNSTDCPTSCPKNQFLCNDGSCSSIECDDTIETPCECETQAFACAKTIKLQDTCKKVYKNQYESYKTCLDEQEEIIEQVSFTGPYFLFCYIWITIVSCLVICWCYYNQKINPIYNSVKNLKPISSIGSPDTANEWTQTGYKKTIIGTIISYMVWITLWSFHILLTMLTIFYYMQQEAITRWKPVFYDEIQVLQAFELVWIIGLVWSLIFQWPESIESLFLRRCELYQATHIAIRAPLRKVEVTATDNKKSYGETFARLIWQPFDFILRTIFAYPYTNYNDNNNFETIYCKVTKIYTNTSVSSFYFRMGRYNYNEEEEQFVPGTMIVGTTIGDFLNLKSGLTTEKAQSHYQIVGPNIIPMDKPTIFGSIVKEFSKSFYIYQHFMVWTWYPYWYYYMAIVNTVVRIGGGLVVAGFQYISDSVLFKISIVEGVVEAIRDGVKVSISLKDVVPGDVIVLKPGIVFCDLVVVQSDHLMVDEAALTGESTPIMKNELDDTLSKIMYDETRHKVHSVYAGTEIIETGDKGEDLGLVLTTGSFTMKGKLLTDILSYQRHKFLFDDEIKIVLLILAIQATILIFLVFDWLDEQFVFAFFYGVFILGTVIPPLLPTVFVVSVGISANRLQNKRITCTNPEGILVAGKVNVCCFDKTGTITETGMDFIGVESSHNEELKTFSLLGMAVCHSLKVTSTNEIIGNHVDKASFTASESVIKYEKGSNVKITHCGSTYEILKQYDFDNHRQTQSVIVSAENGKKYIFVKGSPESIRSLCKQESIPKTFEEILRTGSKSGVYQLAVAHREYNLDKSISSLTRDDLETDLSFCGFILFQNKMKVETPMVMRDLSDGNILMTMITGDNVLTGICIARESGMSKNETMILGQVGADKQIEWVNVDTNEIVDKPLLFTTTFDLAVTGEVWRELICENYKYALAIAKYVRVFGRCNPTDKVSVVTTLVQLGYITLMCGDGQNDCGALKSAHVGVALSSSDASIVAPFTSLDKTVTSVTEVLREGRCALSSAFKAYSYYIIYGQVETYLQTINVYYFITFSGWIWFFLDGLWSTSLAFTLPLAGAAGKLSPCRPTASLLGPRTMFSVCGMLVWNFFFVIIALVALSKQEWYQCRKWDSEDVSDVTLIGDNYESSVLFVVGGYQYISSAIALNFGYTFRVSWYRNYILVALFLLWSSFVYVMTLHPSKFSCIWRVNCDNEDAVRFLTTRGPVAINNPFNTTVMPLNFRWILVIIITTNLIVLCCWEYFFVNGLLNKLYKFGKDEPLLPSEFANEELPLRENEESNENEPERVIYT